MEGLERLNSLPETRAREELLKCCGSTHWAERMARERPFRDARDLTQKADRVWWGLGREDWLEAFAAHPRIGDREALRARFASTRDWASAEQAGASSAPEAVLEALAEGNRAYEARFGHIFIVCATGRPAEGMLEALKARLANEPAAELRVTAGEQAKITHLRLERLLK